jgi:hypothetical protein
MSSPKAPTQHAVLPLTDPHNVAEAFAHELTGIAVRPDGTCHLTFSTIRPGHHMPTKGFMQDDPDQSRVVSMRLVMPTAALNSIATAIGQVLTGMQTAQLKKPN